VCSRARGETLDVAMGTGRNLPSYPEDVRLTGMSWRRRQSGQRNSGFNRAWSMSQ